MAIFSTCVYLLIVISVVESVHVCDVCSETVYSCCRLPSIQHIFDPVMMVDDINSLDTHTDTLADTLAVPPPPSASATVDSLSDESGYGSTCKSTDY